MTFPKRFCAVLLGGLFVSGMSLAQEQGYWRAASKTASSVTGDVGLSAEKISINFASFTMVEIRPLKPAEVAIVFNGDGATSGPGSLYRLQIPGKKTFLHKNTLCGSEDTQWMAAYAEGKSLQLAFFSGGPMPVFTPEAFADAPNLCGTYSYVR